MPVNLPEKGGYYKMNSACKGEASTGTRWGRWVRGTDSLCLRCGGTLRGMPWNEPCQGEKEGAEYPPCAERERGRSIIKKENREKQDTKKPHHSFSPRKVSLYFPVVLLCKSKHYMLLKSPEEKPHYDSLNQSEILQNTSTFIQYVCTHFFYRRL